MQYGQSGFAVNHNVVGPSGSPFTAGSARNGCSIDATGRVVLGQDFGGLPAALLNDRIIPTQGFMISLEHLTALHQLRAASSNITDGFFSCAINSQAVEVADATGGANTKQVRIDSTNTSVLIVNRIANNPFINFEVNTVVNRCFFRNNNGIMEMQGHTSAQMFTYNVVTGAIGTGNPGGGVGLWKLGKVTAAAVALDAANYVETMIDGVIVKLGIVL